MLAQNETSSLLYQLISPGFEFGTIINGTEHTEVSHDQCN